MHLADLVMVDFGGRRTGGPRDRVTRRQGTLIDSSLGFSHMDKWEVLWTKSTYALRAARQMRPGQVVSAIVGLNCLTMKRRMQETLRVKYGSRAFESPLMPLSFALPDEAGAWLQHISDSPRGEATQWWILKTGQDAGRGLTLLPTHLAREAVVKGDKVGVKHSHELKVIQQYLSTPLLLPLPSLPGNPQLTVQRKFHLRLWLLVTHHSPITAFLHKRGLCLFSTESYSPPSLHAGSASDGGYLQPNQVTNLARNSSGMVWPLSYLWNHLDQKGSTKSSTMWSEMVKGCSLALSAAKDILIEGHRWLKPGIDHYGFQLLGVDFMVDREFRPWLLEFNSSPSIMVEHDDPQTSGLIYEEKRAMMNDIFKVIRPRIWTPDEGRRGGGAFVADSEEGTDFVRLDSR